MVELKPLPVSRGFLLINKEHSPRLNSARNSRTQKGELPHKTKLYNGKAASDVGRWQGKILEATNKRQS